jgi:hypothetical protein
MVVVVMVVVVVVVSLFLLTFHLLWIYLSSNLSDIHVCCMYTTLQC